LRASDSPGPGRAALDHALQLELDGAFKGPLASFAGVPRQAVLAAMTRDGQLHIQFTLGVSVSGVVKGLGGLVKGMFGR
jgi:hypothetical protein